MGPARAEIRTFVTPDLREHAESAMLRAVK